MRRGSPLQEPGSRRKAPEGWSSLNADAFSMLQTTHISVVQLSRIFPASVSKVRLKSLEPVMRFEMTLQA